MDPTLADDGRENTSRSWVRPVLVLSKMVLVFTGLAAIGLSVVGYVGLRRAVEGAPPGSGGGIGAAIVFIAAVGLLGVVLVGLGVVVSHRTGPGTGTAARPTRTQRTVVLVGLAMTAAFPLSVVLPDGHLSALTPTRFLTPWGIVVLLMGLAWVAVDYACAAFRWFVRFLR